MKQLALIAALAFTFAVGCKSDDKSSDKPTEPANTTEPAAAADPATAPTTGTDPATGTEPTAAGDGDEEAIPTAEDFEEEAASEVTEKNLEAELAKMEKELADDE